MLIFVANVLDLYSETLKIFKQRKVVNAEYTLPMYICSVGCHMFNFFNKHKQVYWDSDQIPDMRLHIFMVTLPGFGKSFLINQFMGKSNGLLIESAINVSKIGMMTSAGLVGSIKSTPDGQTVVNKGILQKKADYILGSDEFSNITTSSKSSHSGNLINDLLSALDDGHMNKEQSGGGLEYDTFATVWGATQPGRYDLRSGLSRRFAFVVYVPNIKDIILMRKNRQLSKNVQLDKSVIISYRDNLKKKIDELNSNLTRVEFSEEWNKWIEQQVAVHYEDMIYEKILLGYWIMKLDVIPKVLVLTLNEEIKKVILQQMKARESVTEGVKDTKIMDVLSGTKTVKQKDLVKILLTFGLDKKYIEMSLDTLIANNILNINKDTDVITNTRYRGE